MTPTFGPRRAVWIDTTAETSAPLSAAELKAFETYDTAYRALCAMLYNYAPMSGHPGGSISSGRFVAALAFDAMAYDLAQPDRDDSDVISYAAGHKALGLYAMLALRNEIARISKPPLIAEDHRHQMRLEDLLGFRRNPTHDTPLFKAFRAKALDGHPTPATPFVRLSTGASGVGVGSSFGMALALADWYGAAAPQVHVVEGEGGLTPGRVAESLAFAATSSLKNLVVHLDWNQASIDSNQVTREGTKLGDYVQWDPMEFFYLYDWNVVYVADGFDFQQVIAAQRKVREIDNGQPTAIVYRTTKGWRYGIEGRASHGAGHKTCSPAYYEALPAEIREGLPHCADAALCAGGTSSAMIERCYWDALLHVRSWLESRAADVALLGERIADAKERLDLLARAPRERAPWVDDAYTLASIATLPRELELKPGSETTLRGALGKALGYLNKFSGGAFFVAAADLLGSTSVNEVAKEYEAGFYNALTNPDSRTLSVGGICEDAIAAVLSGVSSVGHHVGVGASYGAFLAPLGHIASRLHAIGNQMRHERTGSLARPMILIMGHAGLKTGEDGPTHADPQPLQMFQENFPAGAAITLTPWEPNELWYVLSAALTKRPSLIAPFVTRPNEKVLDREKLGLSPASDAAQGVYLLRRARSNAEGSLVIQESAVAYAFVTETLPMLEKEGIDLNVWYVSSAELFDSLTDEEKAWIFPESVAMEAMGITGFTLPTMYRWVRSDFGRSMTMHPYMHGHYLGSGSGRAVVHEAGLDGDGQLKQIKAYLNARVRV